MDAAQALRRRRARPAPRTASIWPGRGCGVARFLPRGAGGGLIWSSCRRRQKVLPCRMRARPEPAGRGRDPSRRDALESAAAGGWVGGLETPLPRSSPERRGVRGRPGRGHKQPPAASAPRGAERLPPLGRPPLPREQFPGGEASPRHSIPRTRAHARTHTHSGRWACGVDWGPTLGSGKGLRMFRDTRCLCLHNTLPDLMQTSQLGFAQRQPWWLFPRIRGLLCET